MAYRKVTERHEWTKEDISLLLRLWKDRTPKQIAEELEIDIAQVYYMTREIRKQNPDVLPKKKINKRYGSLIWECINEQ